MFYFNNNNGFKYEYGIYCQVGKATPYIQNIYSDIEQVYRRIEEIERKHNHYRQIFYIDNDFYKNKYTLQAGGTYYKVFRRPVMQWEEFETIEKPQYNNVINFFN